MNIEAALRDHGPAAEIDPENERLLTSAALKKRWGGCSDMLLWRRLRDDPDMPRPLIMHKRRFWYLSEVLAYERTLATRDV